MREFEVFQKRSLFVVWGRIGIVEFLKVVLQSNPPEEQRIAYMMAREEDRMAPLMEDLGRTPTLIMEDRNSHSVLE